MASYPNVAIIVVYFGALPRWFSAWVKSCSYNPDFDWIVFTDSPEALRYKTPTNVSVRQLTLGTFCAKMSRELGFQVSFTTFYKVCDFRPLFWVLLEDVPKQIGRASCRERV